ncbi:MAG: 3-deoxy-8-phosphooctulonate synthase [Saprospiraceae bacterium]|nr:3-deoxy-8-phosphooctulonate synthase [Saprospiraceae bacterium]
MLQQYFSKSNNFTLIAGPCLAESKDLVEEVAYYIHDICKKLNIPFIFKASYRKANRSRIDSFSGVGDEIALNWISDIGKKLNIATTTDIHTEQEAIFAANYVDVLQIPAFLCRQTSLIVTAAKTGKFVNIKKGQFLSPEAMEFAVQKVKMSGNDNILLTERGTSFGYQDLIVDYRGIPTMQSFGVPVIMDCTHSLQQPNQMSGVTGGRPDLIPTIAKAAIAVGVDGIFIETHPNPSVAKSDGANMLPLNQLEHLLIKLLSIQNALRED